MDILHYKRILEAIWQIHENTHTSDLATPVLVENLTSVFSLLIGNDWERAASTDSDVEKCAGILVRLHSAVGISRSS